MVLWCLITCPFRRGIRTSASELMGPWLTIGDPLKDIILSENNIHKIHQPFKINNINFTRLKHTLKKLTTTKQQQQANVVNTNIRFLGIFLAP